MAKETPLQRLKSEVKRAGGPGLVAEAIGTRASHLGNILGGKRQLGRETAVRLRAVLPRVPASVWGDLLTLPLAA
jgi:plasmid maintenance system antidote protein VapI